MSFCSFASLLGGACGAGSENPNMADFVKLKDCTRDQVFPCPKEGCTHSFQRHSSLEKHLAFGTCTKTIERETLLDEAKVKYAARLEEGSSSVPTIPLPPETCPRSTGYVTLPEGFALKQVKKVYRFNEKQREYLTYHRTRKRQEGRRGNCCNRNEKSKGIERGALVQCL